MTVSEIIKSWEGLPSNGKFAFLLRSSGMKHELPEDDEGFIQSLDRYANAKFEDLPWELQDEFQVYVQTSFYQIHFKPKEEERHEIPKG